MQSTHAPRLASLEAERVRRDAASVARALASAETHVAGVGNGAPSTALDAAVDQVHQAIQRLSSLYEHLEALQWDMESAEIDDELLRHGCVRTTNGAWICPDEVTGVSQVEALARLDERLDAWDNLAL